MTAPHRVQLGQSDRPGTGRPARRWPRRGERPDLDVRQAPPGRTTTGCIRRRSSLVVMATSTCRPCPSIPSGEIEQPESGWLASPVVSSSQSSARAAATTGRLGVGVVSRSRHPSGAGFPERTHGIEHADFLDHGPLLAGERARTVVFRCRAASTDRETKHGFRREVHQPIEGSRAGRRGSGRIADPSGGYGRDPARCASRCRKWRRVLRSRSCREDGAKSAFGAAGEVDAGPSSGSAVTLTWRRRRAADGPDRPLFGRIAGPGSRCRVGCARGPVVAQRGGQAARLDRRHRMTRARCSPGSKCQATSHATVCPGSAMSSRATTIIGEPGRIPEHEQVEATA